MRQLPFSRAQLSGCLWLPRIAAKARGFHDGVLGAEYAARFCDCDSVDDHFLRHFKITQADFVAAAARLRDDAAFEAWFRAWPAVDNYRIGSWNALAENLGRPGFPMESRLKEALPTIYRHLDPAGIHSILDLLEADERTG